MFRAFCMAKEMAKIQEKMQYPAKLATAYQLKGLQHIKNCFTQFFTANKKLRINRFIY